MRDFRVLMLLFVGLRVTVLVARDLEGLLTYGDWVTFYRVAEITALTGRLPLIGYWVEYPPLFPWLNTGLYWLLIMVLRAPEHAYYIVWSLIGLAADSGNLVLMRKIGAKLYGPERSLDMAWTYALLGAPLIFMTWNFELLTAFFMLLGLWWLLDGKETRSALGIAIGTLLKVMPGLLIPVVWRFRSLPRAARYTGIVTVLGLLAYLPFLIISPTYTAASLHAQIGKSSWQTIWALLDGNLITGTFGGVGDRLDPTRAYVMLGNPSVIPSWATLATFGGLYIYLLTRPVRHTERALVAFFGMTWCVFLLWAKGWSPQWMAMLGPLILLVFPNRRGVLTVLLLTLVSFVEWPLLLSRGLEQGLYLTVPLRTAILVGLLVAFHRTYRAPDHVIEEA